MATNPVLIQKIKQLRSNGFSLGEIVKATNLPKTTVYDHIRSVYISPELKKTIIEIGRKKVVVINKQRKGKCWVGREVILPQGWPNGLLFLTAHFIFDGVINYGSCVYQNRSEALISRVDDLMNEVFGLEPRRYFYQDTGVYRIAYYNVELASYFKGKALWLIDNIINASILEKRIFLQAFFDDEGCIHWRKSKRIVRGFQKDLKILELVEQLLKDFNIDSTIDRKYKEIIVSRKENLIKFQKEINFSQGIFINPERKNSIWKQKLEKRHILSEMINSYQN
ncbi:MAG: LAGLIDADG family homing endonuclease [Candidatus Pacebacteria bacterium]|nr:LAGLIDADG family homing endonuclease [Candidatus Paceibacterota bacterium]